MNMLNIIQIPVYLFQCSCFSRVTGNYITIVPCIDSSPSPDFPRRKIAVSYGACFMAEGLSDAMTVARGEPNVP